MDLPKMMCGLAEWQQASTVVGSLSSGVLLRIQASGILGNDV